MLTPVHLRTLAAALAGRLRHDDLTRRLYATDASVYRRTPLAVAFPKDVADLQTLIAFAVAHGVGLVPRTAGTSLAGQCVGEGIIVDVSRHFTRILDFDPAAKTVTVEPGVIRDDLNRYLAPHGLFFSPITATASRAMIGGMVGNNSSGATSIRYGCTRDKVLVLETVLADGSLVKFGKLSRAEMERKGRGDSLEAGIYRTLWDDLSPAAVQARIHAGFPHAEIRRRNTGYALDELIRSEPFGDYDAPFNVCKLLAGSEGTLAFTTKVTLQLDDLPPAGSVMIVPHFRSVADCLKTVVPAMAHELYTCEMLDDTILNLTKGNPVQMRNRAFVEGDPRAVLLLEVRGNTEEEVARRRDALLETLKASAAYANPVLEGANVKKALDLRAAGLGILGNMVGDPKAVACIEDTAVRIEDLADYIDDFSATMVKYNQRPVYYAHAGAGELHLRPILNLKDPADVVRFRRITDEVAQLVKRYNGSMSGEHGDGIVRAEYIPLIIGAENYELVRKVKRTFDPHGIFNPGKIVDAYRMDEKLRYEPGREEPEVDTLLDFSDSGGILRLAEKCNGTGVCLRSDAAGGTMCPSYKVTRLEKDGTRGRANALREILTDSSQRNKFDSEELKQVFDLCLSCKGCASDCPSSVDVSLLKAEFQHQYQTVHGTSVRARLFAHNDTLNRLGRSVSTRLTNFVFKNGLTSKLLKSALGVAPERDLPVLSKTSLRRWCKKHLAALQPNAPTKAVYLFVDEFTDQLDADVGIDAVRLLTGLNYEVRLVNHAQSGRAFISKGFLEDAQKVAEENVGIFANLITPETPLLGIEPSALLTFRDEYPRLVKDADRARALAKNCLLIDEFLVAESAARNIHGGMFRENDLNIQLHGHCHQKALASTAATVSMLSLPMNYWVKEILSGCCGMAGSFGYEAEHFNLSMQVGNQVLFPAVLKAPAKTVIAAPGTSCRHQILAGTGREALHPVSVLLRALW